MDIVQAVADDLGVTMTPVETGFDGIQSGAALNAGTCDIVASAITITKERAGKLDFSKPYFDANQGLLVPSGSGLDSLASLAGKKVGVQLATTGETYAKDNGLETVSFEDLGLQVQALKNGEVDAIINDIAVLAPYATDGYEVGTEFVTGEQYGLGVKKGNTALLTAVDATIDRIKSDGTYDTLYAKYIGTPRADRDEPERGDATRTRPDEPAQASADLPGGAVRRPGGGRRRGRGGHRLDEHARAGLQPASRPGHGP